VLATLAVLSLALIPIHITTIYSGLPAHPLFLHVPVILIPVATIWALALIARPAWFSRQGIPLATVTVIALAATNLTIGAGIALRAALHLNGGGGAVGVGGFGGASQAAALVARHAHAASILRLLLIAFTVVLIVTVLAYRIADGMLTGHRGVDGRLARVTTLISLRAVLAVLAVACAYFVFHTGDLGAKAVWQGRLNGGGAGGRAGFSFPGSAGGGTRSGGVPPTGGSGAP
jgi:hypothetical protein